MTRLCIRALLALAIAPLVLASCGQVKVEESSREDAEASSASRDNASSSSAGSSAKPDYRDLLPQEKDLIAMLGGTAGRNPVNAQDKGLPGDFRPAYKRKQAAVNLKWSAAVGTNAYGGPLVAGGRIFVGTNNDVPRDKQVGGDKGVLMCFDEKTGNFLWQAVHDKLDDGQNDYPSQGIASTPALDGNRLYYVSNRCELICADAAGDPETKKAKTYWQLDMVEELKVFPRYLAACSPLIVGDLVYIVTGNGVEEVDHTLPQPKAPSFVAVDKLKGKVAWQSNLPGQNIMDGSWGNAAYGEVDGKGQVIFPGGDGWLYSFEPKSGELLWKFNCNPNNAKYEKGGRGDRNYFLATPVIHDKKVYIGTGQDPQYGGGPGHLWCIDMTKKPKNKDLSPVDDDFDPKSAKNKDSGLVWHFGGEIKPKPEDGPEYRFGRTMSSACIRDDLLYIADLYGYVYCLDAKTGQQHWNYDTKSSDGVWASPYWVDGKIIVCTSGSGEIFVFEHGKTLKEPRKIETRQSIATTPAFANGTLYVLTNSTLYAFGKTEK